MPVLDGERWIAERLRFLRERLSEPLLEEERRAVEAEIEALSLERGIMPGGWRSRGCCGLFVAVGDGLVGRAAGCSARVLYRRRRGT